MILVISPNPYSPRYIRADPQQLCKPTKWNFNRFKCENWSHNLRKGGAAGNRVDCNNSVVWIKLPKPHSQNKPCGPHGVHSSYDQLLFKRYVLEFSTFTNIITTYLTIAYWF